MGPRDRALVAELAEQMPRTSDTAAIRPWLARLDREVLFAEGRPACQAAIGAMAEEALSLLPRGAS